MKTPEFIDAIASLISGSEGKIIFLEEGIRGGGMGMTLFSLMASLDNVKRKDVKILAIDSFAHSVKNEHLYKTCKISKDDILEALEG